MGTNNSSKVVSIEIEGCTMTDEARRAQRSFPEEVTMDLSLRRSLERDILIWAQEVIHIKARKSRE